VELYSHHDKSEGHEGLSQLLYFYFVPSFENTGADDDLLHPGNEHSSVIPAKAGNQANPALPKPGFPRARE
jgi:hypothetical protein